ncbi:MAG: hypothetical protein OEY79_04185, partial [Anaplasmataceae bacterium]|nr:hypothetical protein [Anaplasmataceae bacterium]
MSWYNEEQENNFIDATQEFTGGGVSTSISEVQNAEDLVITETTPDTEETTTIGNVLLPAVLNEENGSYDLYIRNVNQDGRIFFTTRGDGEKIKIEDGKLKLYYEYDFLNAPLILAGWTDILDYSVTTRQITDGLLVNVGVIDATLYTPVTGHITRLPIVEGVAASALSSTIDHEARIIAIETDMGIDNLELDTFEDSLDSGLQQYRNEMGSSADDFLEMVRQSAYQGGNARNVAGVFLRSRKNFILAFFGSVISAIGLLSVISGIAFGIYDRLTERDLLERETKLLLTYEKIKDESDSNVAELIHKDGLSIVASTNGGFTLAGVYEVDIANNNRLEIEIKNVSGSLVAEIKEVLQTSAGFTVGDVISIPKSDLGGGTGNLEINVNTLYTERQLLVKLIEETEGERVGLENRQRRRRNIPNTSSFSSDGFTITNTAITEPITNEVTNEPAISLKVDTSQFSYDASGNLQLTGFANIGNTGNLGIPSDETQNPPIVATGLNLQVETNTGNIETLQTNLGVASSIIPLVNATGLNLDVETLREEVGDNTSIPKTGIYKSIDDIFNLLGTIPDYDENGNVVDLATGIYARIDNIYKVVMEEGYTFDNNTDYKLSLGYDTVWNGFHYNLFCVALKTIRSGAFSSSFYGNDFMGLFPSLERLIDKPTEYVLVKDLGIILLTNFHIGEGLLYFNNVSPTIDYDLARKFELVIFLTPKNIDNLNVEYTILQTGIKIGSEYEIDNNKLKLSIINNKLNITNYIYYNAYYYQSLTTSLFNTYMLSTFATNGSFYQNTTTGLKEAINTVSGRTHYIGIKSVQISPTTVPTDQVWYDIVRSAGGQTSSFYYWNFDILRDMTYQPQTWKSPIFYYKEDLPLPANRNNFSKIKIRYDMENFTTGVGWSSASFGSQNAIDTGLEFKMKI